MDPADTWETVKLQLRLTMERDPWYTWLAPTTGTAIEDGSLLITVPNPHIADWLAHRLHRPIAQALADTGLTPLYIVPPNLPANTPDPYDTDAEITLRTTDPRELGFVIVTNYAAQFWQPTLGPDAWSLYLTLRSFAYNAQHTAWPSIATLAAICTNGNRQRITGRAARRGHPPQAGAIEKLEDAGLLTTTIRGHASTIRYQFAVVPNPPLLTRDQVHQLPDTLQRLHQRTLKRLQTVGSP